MLFSYNWLQSFFSASARQKASYGGPAVASGVGGKRKLPKPKRLAGLIIKHAFEVEGIKKVGQDYVLDIAVLANRGSDCFSHIGIAREIAAILNYKLQIPEYKLIESEELKARSFVKVEVKNKAACPRYTARVITDVEVGTSPRWLREKLEICGLRSINNIVDITNYIMLETGQPLHAFDCDKLAGRKIIVRFAKRGEKITTLDNEKYELDYNPPTTRQGKNTNSNILVISDAEKPIAIAGIKGGKTPEIDGKTKIVVLESANFNPKTIRRASKLIDLKTDASWRFEHGLDQNLAEFAINRAASLVQKIAGGEITKGLIDARSKKIPQKRILLNLDYVNKLLGLKIEEKEIKSILEGLSFKVLNTRYKIQDTKCFLVEVPTFRLDISLPEDLIEEIGRIYGYEKIPSVFPLATLFPPKRNLDLFWENIAKDILSEIGFTEVYNYSFISERDAEIFKYKNPASRGNLDSRSARIKNKELIEIENSISSDFQYLRPSLIPNLLKNIERNQKNFSEIKIFELGKIFEGKNEKKMLSGVSTGEAFYQMKGIIDTLFNEMGISNIWYDEYQPTPEDSKLSIWRVGKCAEIKIDHQEIGFLGEISPDITKEIKIEPKVIVFDLDFEKLIKLASEEHEYRPISRYPEAIRDIAVLVPREISVEEVLNKIEEVGQDIIRDIDLFDIYEGEEFPDDKKNLAFHIIFQAEDRTLSSKEIDELQNKIIKVLEENPEWQVRK